MGTSHWTARGEKHDLGDLVLCYDSGVSGCGRAGGDLMTPTEMGLLIAVWLLIGYGAGVLFRWLKTGKLSLILALFIALALLKILNWIEGETR